MGAKQLALAFGQSSSEFDGLGKLWIRRQRGESAPATERGLEAHTADSMSKVTGGELNPLLVTS